MKKANELCLCECGHEMQRNFKVDLFNSGNKEYNKPIVSDSLAIMPSQREEHLRRFPDIKLDNENRPVFDSFQPHENYLKKTGFKKARQRIKRRGKKIA